MLLVVSITFVIVTMPIVTMQQIERQLGISMNEIRGICLVLQYLNHSCNFFLYAVTGKTFRNEFFALFGKKTTHNAATAAATAIHTNYKLRRTTAAPPLDTLTVNNHSRKKAFKNKNATNNRLLITKDDLSSSNDEHPNNATTTTQFVEMQNAIEKNNISSSTASIFP